METAEFNEYFENIEKKDKEFEEKEAEEERLEEEREEQSAEEYLDRMFGKEGEELDDDDDDDEKSYHISDSESHLSGLYDEIL
jgi:hypothetical protein